MARWNRVIKGYGAISEAYKADEIDAQEAGRRLAALLREKIGDVIELSLGDETVDGLSNNLNIDTIVLDFEQIEDVEDFDNVLDHLYDWADDNLVWIDPFDTAV